MDGGGSGGGDDPGLDESVPEHLRTTCLSLWIEPEYLTLESREGKPLPIAEIPQLDPDLRSALEASGARTLRPQFPDFEPGTTTAVDCRGKTVRINDLSVFYLVEYDTSQDAWAAPSNLLGAPGVRAADPVNNLEVMNAPTDPYYQRYPAWPPGSDCDSEDCLWSPLWHLGFENPRPATYNCPGGVAGQGTNAAAIDDWWPFPAAGWRAIIGMIDTGIGFQNTANYHEDLDVVPLTQTQREHLNAHPNNAWCIPHGTAMSGLAAARTDNYIGVAGVCSDCRVLNMESSDCTDEQCTAHVEETACNRIDGAFWPQSLDYARSHFLVDGLRAVLLSAGSVTDTNVCATAGQIAPLWNAYIQGVNTVVPSGDTSYGNRKRLPIGSLPFVIGTGGHVHDGRFWEPPTSCYNDPGQGASAAIGVDICGPACPEVVTTIPDLLPGRLPPDFLLPEEVGPYYYTSSQCSGAAAVAAGALGFLHTYALWYCAGIPTQDDLLGILLASARPFTADPLETTLCTDCKRSDYGRGMVDLPMALHVLQVGFEPPPFGPLTHFEVARFGDPGG